MPKAAPRYSCDFETTTQKEDCRVWAWVAVNIDKSELRFFGNNMQSFIAFLQKESCTCYFHNLKFDGEFILSYLLQHDFTLNKSVKNLSLNEFNTLISDSDAFYTIEIQFIRARIKIIDSLKLLPYSVDTIAKGFKLPISKLKIDYKERREIGHVLTPEETEYILNDALIVASALKVLFEQGFSKITAGSNAFAFYKKGVGGEKNFRRIFPVPECDRFIRKSYKGGFTYVAPQYQNKQIDAGRVYDVNSLYPFALHSPHIYPYGEPIYYKGEYIKNQIYPLYIQHFSCAFEVRPGYLPTIQLKNNLRFMPTEYVTSSKGETIELYLTCIDLELFLKHYDVERLTYIDGYEFKAEAGLFDEYIDYWFAEKSKAKEQGNAALYQLSKLMLNSLYGKFSTNPETKSKWPYLDDKQIVRYAVGDTEEKEPIYIPVGTFCTSYARAVTINAAQKVYPRFMYADTDSLHLYGDEETTEIEIDDFKLGAFKHEAIFTGAKYLRAKMYMEYLREPHEPPGCEKWKVTGAGLTESCKEFVNINNFHIGASYAGKLKPCHVPGGIVFEDTTFTIREI